MTMPNTVDLPSLTDRVRGALLGTACGDAFGAPFEGACSVPLAEVEAWTHSPRVFRYTDDTAMTIALAEHLAELDADEPLEEQRLAEVFAQHWLREPWRGYGAGPPQIFRLILAGTHWREAAATPFPPHGSFGNGAAMRIAPLACITTNFERLVEDARTSARPTHLHPLGQDGAVVQAIAVWSALHSDPRQRLDAHLLLDRIAAHVGAPEYREKLARVGELASTATPERAAAEIGNGTAAATSVPTALLAFLRHPNSFVDAVTFAIRVCGDTDTIAAMAGAIAGARHGIAAIPQSWRDRLENFPTLHHLGTRLGHRLGEQHQRSKEEADQRHG